MAPHWHDDVEIIYIKKGRGFVDVNLVKYSVQAGDAVFIKPGYLHSISAPPGERMEYENIIFEMNFLSSMRHEAIYTDFFIPWEKGEITLPTLISPNSFPDYDAAISYLDQADKAGESKSTAYQISIKGFLFCFFSILFSNSIRYDNTSNIKNDTNIEKIKLLLNHIKENYKGDISVGDAASVCGFSESHFMRFFKQHMGTSFTAYLNDYRLSMAAKSLRETGDTILDISAECGFNNLSFFNRMFKNKYGISPRMYRKMP